MQSSRSPRARQILAAAGIVLAGLSLGTGAAGAFPNGPIVISDDPIPPLPPQAPDDFADAPDPQPPAPGPQDWANPAPDPVIDPIPGPGPQQGGGSQGGDQDQDASEQPDGPAGPTAEDFAAIAAQLDAAADDAAVDADGQADGTVGKESDRPDTTDVDDTDELAAGELTTEQGQSGPWALFAALGAMALAAISGLILFLARRRHDEDEAVAS
jgi:hypothetical protein